MRNIPLVAFLVASVLASFLSCRGDDEARGGRTVEEYQRLKAVGDSVNMQSPRARELVDSALANTSDSLNYYDYYTSSIRAEQQPKSL